MLFFSSLKSSNQWAEISLSEQQVKELKQKGFIVLKSFFDAPSIVRVSSIANELHGKTPEENQEAKYYETSPVTGQDVLVRIEHMLGDYNSELTNLIITPKVDGCLAQLFGEPHFCLRKK
jgi:hypothetical protein